MKVFKRIIVFSLVYVLGISQAGCNSVSDLPTESLATKYELQAFYKDSLKYDVEASNKVEKARNLVELYELDSKKKRNELIGLYEKTEGALGAASFDKVYERSKVLDESGYKYVRGFLNDKVLSGGKVVAVKTALNYYFVDVEYGVGSRQNFASPKASASLLGLHGGFYRDVKGNDLVDSTFLKRAVEKLNEHYVSEGIAKQANYNQEAMVFSVSGDARKLPQSFTKDFSERVKPVKSAGKKVVEQKVEENLDAQLLDTADGVESGAESGEESTGAGDKEVRADIAESAVAKAVSPSGVRSIDEAAWLPKLNLREVNGIVGASLKSVAYVPRLDMVMNLAGSEGTVSGIGVYPQGMSGLHLFGFDGGNLRGKCVLRYVYKEDLEDKGKLEYSNIYPVSMVIDNGIAVDPKLAGIDIKVDTGLNEKLVPGFVRVELEKMVERADRVVINEDIAGVMAGGVYLNLGKAVLLGYAGEGTNLSRQITTLTRVIGRDMANSAYLIEFDRLRDEGSKSSNVYGSYIEKGYMVLEQVGTKFYITDEVVTSKLLKEMPDVTVDSAVEKKLVALNLSGEVSSKTKQEIGKLIGNLYTASTNRKLYGDKEQGTVGMYDCFNSDKEVLSEDYLELLNSELRSDLLKYGVNTSCAVSGKVASWLGGAENQAEFIMSEVYTYGDGTVEEKEVYYLVSNLRNKWVIDERKILEMQR